MAPTGRDAANAASDSGRAAAAAAKGVSRADRGATAGAGAGTASSKPSKSPKSRKSPNSPRRTADDWVRAALRVLAAGPISAVKVELLAKDLGVTKGSFYWHFEDREALLAAMRQAWVEGGTEQIIEFIAETGPSRPPAEVIRQLVALTLSVSGDLDGLEAAIREWSAHDPETARVCAEVDDRRLSFVTDQFVMAGMSPEVAADRASVLYRILIGEYMWRRYGGEPINVDAVYDVVDGFFS